MNKQILLEKQLSCQLYTMLHDLIWKREHYAVLFDTTQQMYWLLLI